MRTDSVTVKLATAQEKSTLRNLMQAYRHDLSEFNGALPETDGLYSLGNYFDDYWIESTRYPYKIEAGTRLAGCALVRELAPNVHSIAEFFVLRPFRTGGIGRQAANLLFELHPGEWHISQDEENLPAQNFWKKIVGEITNGDYRDDWSTSNPRGPKQVFTHGVA